MDMIRHDNVFINKYHRVSTVYFVKRLFYIMTVFGKLDFVARTGEGRATNGRPYI